MKKLDGPSFEEIIYDDGEPCLVIFSRQSCHVCQQVHPKIEELSEDSQYEGKFSFYEVDVEEEPGMISRFSLKGVPQVLFFNDGEFLGKLAGDHPNEEYEEKIEEIIG